MSQVISPSTVFCANIHSLICFIEVYIKKNSVHIFFLQICFLQSYYELSPPYLSPLWPYPIYIPQPKRQWNIE